jgi:hypothetical protein
MAAIEVGAQFPCQRRSGARNFHAVSQSKTGSSSDSRRAGVGFLRAAHHRDDQSGAAQPVEELTEGAHQVASAFGQVSTSAQTLSQGAT